MKVGYCRLSKGDEDGLTIQMQHDACNAAGCKRIYSEVISGNASHRPQWEALKQDITDGRITEVVAYRFDRLSRSWTAIGEVIDLFSRPDAPRLTLTHDTTVDLSTTGGRTVAGVLASVAAGERERIAARSKAGLAKRSAAGKRHKLPFGLMADREGYPVPDTRKWVCPLDERPTNAASDHQGYSRAEVAVLLWEAWEQSPTRYASARVAAERFGIQRFGGGSSAGWSSNPMLRGALTGGRRDKRHGVYPSIKEDAFEALIEPKRHRAAVAAFMNSRVSNARGQGKRATPLSGKVWCCDCGKSTSLHRNLSRPGTAWTFRCRSIGCPQYDKRIRYGVIKDAIRGFLFHEDNRKRLLAALVNDLTPVQDTRELDRAITDAEAKVQDFSDMVSKYPDMKPMREQLAKAQAELAQLHSDRDNWSPAHFLPPDEVLRRGLMAMLRRKQANSDGSISFDVHPDEDPAAVLREIELMEKGKHPLMDQLTADDAVKVLLADDRYWEENHGEDIRLAVHHVTVNGITKEVVDVVPLWD